MIDENPDLPEAELKKKISAAYPFGPREMWPYKVWLDEVKRAVHPEKFVYVSTRTSMSGKRNTPPMPKEQASLL